MLDPFEEAASCLIGFFLVITGLGFILYYPNSMLAYYSYGIFGLIISFIFVAITLAVIVFAVVIVCSELPSWIYNLKEIHQAKRHPKYEFTNEAHPKYPDTYRIRALKNIKRHGVSAGDLGGFVEKRTVPSLSHKGDAWVADNAVLTFGSRAITDAIIKDNAVVKINSVISGAAIISDNATVSYSSQIKDMVEISGTAEVIGCSYITQNVKFNAGEVRHDMRGYLEYFM